MNISKPSVALMLLVIVYVNLQAQEIRLIGSPKFSLDLNIKPGDDFAASLETTNTIDLDIKKLSKNAYWSVLVSKNDIVWNNQIKIYVRRTSSGNGKGSVYGGLSYIQINDLKSTFLTGYERLNGIGIQYKITGMDITLQAGNYYTDIVYTLFEN